MSDYYKELIEELYEGLKGTREVNGELKIFGYEDEDYQALYEYLLEALSDFFEGDYYTWYAKVVNQYLRFKRTNARRYDVNYPHERNIFDHTLREQLTIMKFFVYRRYYSYFGRGSKKQWDK